MPTTVSPLRKCPSCHDQVGAASTVCPRCGVNFRSAVIRKIILRTMAILVLAWLVIHFAIRR